MRRLFRSFRGLEGGLQVLLMRFLPLRHIIALQQFRLVGIALVAILLSSHRVSHLILEGPLRMAVRACLGLVGAPDGGVEF